MRETWPLIHWPASLTHRSRFSFKCSTHGRRTSGWPSNGRGHRRRFPLRSIQIDETLASCLTVCSYWLSRCSSRWRLESLDDLGDAVGEGDDGRLLAWAEGDGSSESGTDKDRRIFSNISPMTTNDGSTMYWIKPRSIIRPRTSLLTGSFGLPICDSATRVLSRSHKGEQGRPSSFSFSPCLKYSSINDSVQVKWIGHGLPGWLISAQCSTKAKALDFSMLEWYRASLSFHDWCIEDETHFSGILRRLFMVLSWVKCELISVARTISMTNCRKFLQRGKRVHHWRSHSVNWLVFSVSELCQDIVIIDTHQSKGCADMMILQNGSIIVDQSHIRSRIRVIEARSRSARHRCPTSIAHESYSMFLCVRNRE